MRVQVLAAVLFVLSGVIGTTESAAQAPFSAARIAITAQQVSASPPRYVFLVTNLSDQPLMTIYLGNTADDPLDERRMMNGTLNIPTRVTLPDGWSASLTPDSGTGFVSYHWSTGDRAKAIRPGESRCDFKVELPVFVPRNPPLYRGRRLLAQTTYDNLPFVVIWADGVVTEGVVEAHLLSTR
jgi:hypothetical protein